jgi:hypothetical protein
MAANVVCQTSLCQCTQGSLPTPLKVTSQQISLIGGLPVATVMDKVPGANLTPFGICQQLTKAASGTRTPCVPATTGPWKPGSTVSVINGIHALTASSKLDCSVGGQISVNKLVCPVEANYE